MAAEVIHLKGGYTTKDRRLDRIPQFDPESLNYRIRSYVIRGKRVEEKDPRSWSWGINTWLDQGVEGRCVEYSICHDLRARPAQVPQHLVDQILAGKRIYWPAQESDAWPGGSYPGASPHYEGTSVLAAMCIAKKLGLYGEYRWATTLENAVRALGHVGPLILGINWYADMQEPDANGWIRPTGGVDGGHAILAPKVKIVWRRKGSTAWDNVDLDQSYIVLHNSWGPTWGTNGRARMTLNDFDRLRREDGEVAIPTQRYVPEQLAA